jgi:hypothetical protein
MHYIMTRIRPELQMVDPHNKKWKKKLGAGRGVIEYWFVFASNLSSMRLSCRKLGQEQKIENN